MYLKRSFKISPNDQLKALHSEEHLAAHVTPSLVSLPT